MSTHGWHRCERWEAQLLPCPFDEQEEGQEDDDANSDGDLIDAGDTRVINEPYDATSRAFAFDKAGNLIDDG